MTGMKIGRLSASQAIYELANPLAQDADFHL
jgi:hypothetical protein